jgi:hypothetical protein
LNKTGNQSSSDGHHSAGVEALQESKGLLSTFSHASAIGFAILDNQLRYQAINNCLAGINGMPAEAHLGFTVREIFGEVSEQIAEPSYRRVLDRGEITHFEITNAVLPARIDSHYCGLNLNFPIRDRAGRIERIGILVVEVTEQRKLERFFHELAGELRHTKTREHFWFTRDLQASIHQYHAALAMSLGSLIADRVDPETNAEQLAQSVELLDQRIVNMRKLVSSVASRFPMNQQF